MRRSIAKARSTKNTDSYSRRISRKSGIVKTAISLSGAADAANAGFDLLSSSPIRPNAINVGSIVHPMPPKGSIGARGRKLEALDQAVDAALDLAEIDMQSQRGASGGLRSANTIDSTTEALQNMSSARAQLASTIGHTWDVSEDTVNKAAQMMGLIALKDATNRIATRVIGNLDNWESHIDGLIDMLGSRACYMDPGLDSWSGTWGSLDSLNNDARDILQFLNAVKAQGEEVDWSARFGRMTLGAFKDNVLPGKIASLRSSLEESKLSLSSKDAREFYSRTAPEQYDALVKFRKEEHELAIKLRDEGVVSSLKGGEPEPVSATPVEPEPVVEAPVQQRQVGDVDPDEGPAAKPISAREPEVEELEVVQNLSNVSVGERVVFNAPMRDHVLGPFSGDPLKLPGSWIIFSIKGSDEKMMARIVDTHGGIQRGQGRLKLQLGGDGAGMPPRDFNVEDIRVHSNLGKKTSDPAETSSAEFESGAYFNPRNTENSTVVEISVDSVELERQTLLGSFPGSGPLAEDIPRRILGTFDELVELAEAEGRSAEDAVRQQQEIFSKKLSSGSSGVKEWLDRAAEVALGRVKQPASSSDAPPISSRTPSKLPELEPLVEPSGLDARVDIREGLAELRFRQNNLNPEEQAEFDDMAKLVPRPGFKEQLTKGVLDGGADTLRENFRDSEPALEFIDRLEALLRGEIIGPAASRQPTPSAPILGDPPPISSRVEVPWSPEVQRALDEIDGSNDLDVILSKVKSLNLHNHESEEVRNVVYSKVEELAGVEQADVLRRMEIPINVVGAEGGTFTLRPIEVSQASGGSKKYNGFAHHPNASDDDIAKTRSILTSDWFSELISQDGRQAILLEIGEGSQKYLQVTKSVVSEEPDGFVSVSISLAPHGRGWFDVSSPLSAKVDNLGGYIKGRLEAGHKLPIISLKSSDENFVNRAEVLFSELIDGSASFRVRELGAPEAVSHEHVLADFLTADLVNSGLNPRTIGPNDAVPINNLKEGDYIEVTLPESTASGQERKLVFLVLNESKEVSGSPAPVVVVRRLGVGQVRPAYIPLGGPDITPSAVLRGMEQSSPGSVGGYTDVDIQGASARIFAKKQATPPEKTKADPQTEINFTETRRIGVDEISDSDQADALLPKNEEFLYLDPEAILRQELQGPYRALLESEEGAPASPRASFKVEVANDGSLKLEPYDDFAIALVGDIAADSRAPVSIEGGKIVLDRNQAAAVIGAHVGTPEKPGVDVLVSRIHTMSDALPKSFVDKIFKSTESGQKAVGLEPGERIPFSNIDEETLPTSLRGLVDSEGRSLFLARADRSAQNNPPGMPANGYAAVAVGKDGVVEVVRPMTKAEAAEISNVKIKQDVAPPEDVVEPPPGATPMAELGFELRPGQNMSLKDYNLDGLEGTVISQIKDILARDPSARIYRVNDEGPDVFYKIVYRVGEGQQPREKLLGKADAEIIDNIPVRQGPDVQVASGEIPVAGLVRRNGETVPWDDLSPRTRERLEWLFRNSDSEVLSRAVAIDGTEIDGSIVGTTVRIDWPTKADAPDLRGMPVKSVNAAVADVSGVDDPGVIYSGDLFLDPRTRSIFSIESVTISTSVAADNNIVMRFRLESQGGRTLPMSLDDFLRLYEQGIFVKVSKEGNIIGGTQKGASNPTNLRDISNAEIDFGAGTGGAPTPRAILVGADQVSNTGGPFRGADIKGFYAEWNRQLAFLANKASAFSFADAENGIPGAFRVWLASSGGSPPRALYTPIIAEPVSSSKMKALWARFGADYANGEPLSYRVTFVTEDATVRGMHASDSVPQSLKDSEKYRSMLQEIELEGPGAPYSHTVVIEGFDSSGTLKVKFEIDDYGSYQTLSKWNDDISPDADGALSTLVLSHPSGGRPDAGLIDGAPSDGYRVSDDLEASPVPETKSAYKPHEWDEPTNISSRSDVEVGEDGIPKEVARERLSPRVVDVNSEELDPQLGSFATAPNGSEVPIAKAINGEDIDAFKQGDMTGAGGLGYRYMSWEPSGVRVLSDEGEVVPLITDTSRFRTLRGGELSARGSDGNGLVVGSSQVGEQRGFVYAYTVEETFTVTSRPVEVDEEGVPMGVAEHVALLSGELKELDYAGASYPVVRKANSKDISDFNRRHQEQFQSGIYKDIFPDPDKFGGRVVTIEQVETTPDGDIVYRIEIKSIVLEEVGIPKAVLTGPLKKSQDVNGNIVYYREAYLAIVDPYTGNMMRYNPSGAYGANGWTTVRIVAEEGVTHGPGRIINPNSSNSRASSAVFDKAEWIAGEHGKSAGRIRNLWHDMTGGGTTKNDLIDVDDLLVQRSGSRPLIESSEGMEGEFMPFDNYGIKYHLSGRRTSDAVAAPRAPLPPGRPLPSNYRPSSDDVPVPQNVYHPSGRLLDNVGDEGSDIAARVGLDDARSLTPNLGESHIPVSVNVTGHRPRNVSDQSWMWIRVDESGRLKINSEQTAEGLGKHPPKPVDAPEEGPRGWVPDSLPADRVITRGEISNFMEWAQTNGQRDLIDSLDNTIDELNATGKFDIEGYNSDDILSISLNEISPGNYKVASIKVSGQGGAPVDVLLSQNNNSVSVLEVVGSGRLYVDISGLGLNIPVLRVTRFKTDAPGLSAQYLSENDRIISVLGNNKVWYNESGTDLVIKNKAAAEQVKIYFRRAGILKSTEHIPRKSIIITNKDQTIVEKVVIMGKNGRVAVFEANNIMNGGLPTVRVFSRGKGRISEGVVEDSKYSVEESIYAAPEEDFIDGADAKEHGLRMVRNYKGHLVIEGLESESVAGRGDEASLTVWDPSKNKEIEVPARLRISDTDEGFSPTITDYAERWMDPEFRGGMVDLVNDIYTIKTSIIRGVDGGELDIQIPARFKTKMHRERFIKVMNVAFRNGEDILTSDTKEAMQIIYEVRYLYELHKRVELAKLAEAKVCDDLADMLVGVAHSELNEKELKFAYRKLIEQWEAEAKAANVDDPESFVDRKRWEYARQLYTRARQMRSEVGWVPKSGTKYGPESIASSSFVSDAAKKFQSSFGTFYSESEYGGLRTNASGVSFQDALAKLRTFMINFESDSSWGRKWRRNHIINRKKVHEAFAQEEQKIMMPGESGFPNVQPGVRFVPEGSSEQEVINGVMANFDAFSESTRKAILAKIQGQAVRDAKRALAELTTDQVSGTLRDPNAPSWFASPQFRSTLGSVFRSTGTAAQWVIPTVPLGAPIGWYRFMLSNPKLGPKFMFIGLPLLSIAGGYIHGLVAGRPDYYLHNQLLGYELEGGVGGDPELLGSVKPRTDSINPVGGGDWYNPFSWTDKKNLIHILWANGRLGPAFDWTQAAAKAKEIGDVGYAGSALPESMYFGKEGENFEVLKLALEADGEFSADTRAAVMKFFLRGNAGGWLPKQLNEDGTVGAPIMSAEEWTDIYLNAIDDADNVTELEALVADEYARIFAEKQEAGIQLSEPPSDVGELQSTLERARGELSAGIMVSFEEALRRSKKEIDDQIQAAMEEADVEEIRTKEDAERVLENLHKVEEQVDDASRQGVGSEVIDESNEALRQLLEATERRRNPKKDKGEDFTEGTGL